jgi:hypothetical protein
MLVSMKQHQLSYQKALTAIRLERLHFAVEFVQKNLSQLREGDWLNLREDFLAFLGQSRNPERWLTISDAGGLVSSKWDPPFPQDFSEQDFRVLQDEVCTILRAAAGDNMGAEPPIIGVRTELRIQPLDGRVFPSGGYLTNIFGSTRDQFLFILLEALRQEPPDRILRCPECQTLFVRAYTQTYCSRRCTNRASVRSWRTRQEVPST